MQVYIPERFKQAVDNHIVGNLLDLDGYPLILSIFGAPGVGKTFQLRTHLEERGFSVHSINAADLESGVAGEPAKLLRKEYVEAGREMSHGKGAAIVIDDVDTTLGEWEKYTGTVNHQGLIAFFMHIADSPTRIESIGCPLKRVPIFFTGNDIAKLYEPLSRAGRMNLFQYSPSVEEKTAILSVLFGEQHADAVKSFVMQHPEKPVSYFSGLRASVEAEVYSSFAQGMDYGMLASSESYRALKKRELDLSVGSIDWTDLLQSQLTDPISKEDDAQ